MGGHDTFVYYGDGTRQRLALDGCTDASFWVVLLFIFPSSSFRAIFATSVISSTLQTMQSSIPFAQSHPFSPHLQLLNQHRKKSPDAGA